MHAVKPQPTSQISVTGRRPKRKASRVENEQARRLRLIVQAHTNWKRKMGLIPTEAESEGQP